METFFTTVDQNELNTNLRNILAMNTFDEYDDDGNENYDIDCDSDNLYYES